MSVNLKSLENSIIPVTKARYLTERKYELYDTKEEIKYIKNQLEKNYEDVELMEIRGEIYFSLSFYKTNYESKNFNTKPYISPDSYYKLRELSHSMEFWEPVPHEGFGENYLVSSLGNVFSIKRGKLIKKSYFKSKYTPSVSLSYRGNTQSFLVHILVGNAFSKYLQKEEYGYMGEDKENWYYNVDLKAPGTTIYNVVASAKYDYGH